MPAIEAAPDREQSEPTTMASPTAIATADMPVEVAPVELPAVEAAPVEEAASPEPVAPTIEPEAALPTPEPEPEPEPVAEAAPEPEPETEPVMEAVVADAPVPAAVYEPAAVAAPEPKPTPSAPVERIMKGLFPMATTYDPTATAGAAADKAKAMFGDMNERAKGAMEKSVKIGEEMTDLTKGNMEAVVASSRVYAKGVESMAQDYAETVKKHFEAATATMKSMTSVKSPTELFQLQSEFAKASFDHAVADASKFSEQLLKLMGDVAQPLSSRYAVAAEKVKSTTL